MAGYGGRCAQNYKKIVQKIIQNIWGHHRWRRGLFKELEVGLGDFGDGVGQAKVGQADQDDAVGLEVLDLSGDTGKGAPDDADLAARPGVRLIDLKGDAQALDIFTGLGIDEILHLFLGDRDNLTLLFPTPPGLGHELNREEIRI